MPSWRRTPPTPRSPAAIADIAYHRSALQKSLETLAATGARSQGPTYPSPFRGADHLTATSSPRSLGDYFDVAARQVDMTGRPLARLDLKPFIYGSVRRRSCIRDPVEDRPSRYGLCAENFD